MPVAFAAAQVEVDLAEAHRVGARAAPVDVFPELAGAEQIVELLLAGRLAAAASCSPARTSHVLRLTALRHEWKP